MEILKVLLEKKVHLCWERDISPGTHLNIVVRDVAPCTLAVPSHEPAFLVALLHHDVDLFVLCHGELIGILKYEESITQLI